MKNKDFAWKCWHFFVIFWPLLCFVFMGIIIGQSDRTVDERIADVGFTVISLIFFAMGMSIRRRLLKEQRTAVALTTAVVVSGGRQKRTGRNPEYYPEFEFQANGVNYRVRSHGGSGSRLVKGGSGRFILHAGKSEAILRACAAKVCQALFPSLLWYRYPVSPVWPVCSADKSSVFFFAIMGCL